MRSVSRLCVSCQHQRRRRTRGVLWAAGDNGMSQRVTRGRKASALTVLCWGAGGTQSPPRFPGVLWKATFQAPVRECLAGLLPLGLQQEIKASGRRSWGGSWPLCSGPEAAP